MRKNIIQDVIPPKKSIRNVKLSSRSLKDNRESAKVEIVEEDFSRSAPVKNEPPVKKHHPILNKSSTSDSSYKYEDDEPKKSSKKILYISIFILVVSSSFGLSTFFKSAKITITPKNQTEELNEVFIAKKDVSSGGLGFQIVTVVKDVEKNVESEGESTVDKKAQGTVVIYNDYSSESQKLIATTRFQTPEGLVFRSVSPVTVPGKTIKNGKSVAGSVEVLVEADKPGSDYNISFKDFVIPGFKGDPKYTKIYARSKTEMIGGFSGMQKTVSKTTLDSVTNEMEESLKTSLSKDIISQIPADFVLYTSSLSYKFDQTTQANNSTGGVVLKKRGLANAIIFDKGLLSREILNKILINSSDNLIKITNLEDLTFTYDKTLTGDINKISSVSFSLKGNPQFVWVVDENKIKSELLGLSKNEAKNIIAKYLTIKEAWIETRPFWSQTIPSNKDKVTIINTLTK